jgi:Zn-dependent peptidase ImmA (M78 family)
MKSFRAASEGQRPFFSEEDVENICEDALRSSGYYPDAPQPVKVDRFVEKHFMVSPRFEDMPAGVLGFSRFGDRGMVSMHISKVLVEENSRAAERRVNTTLAHEAGHGLMHTHLFVLSGAESSLFGHGSEVENQRVLCRDEKVMPKKVYDGRWWELQANMAIGPLLMPRRVLGTALQPFLVKRGTFGAEEIDPNRREEALRHVADIFDVNPAAARIRIAKVYRPMGNQLTL